MEPKFNTSFIPKKSLQADVSGATPGRYVNRRSTLRGPIFSITFVAFLAVAAYAFFVYFRVSQLQSEVTKQSKTINDNIGAYDVITVKDLMRESTRIKEAYALLQNHVAATRLLRVLEANTLKKIQYLNLVLTGATPEKSASVAIDGASADYQSVAQQIRRLSDEEYAAASEDRKKHLFADLTLTKLGKGTDLSVLFSLTATVDPWVLSYTNSLHDATTTLPAVGQPQGGQVPPPVGQGVQPTQGF